MSDTTPPAGGMPGDEPPPSTTPDTGTTQPTTTTPTTPTSPEATTKPPVWPGDAEAKKYLRIAGWCAGVVLFLAAVVAIFFFDEDGALSLASVIAVPLVVLGVLLTCAGAALAAVEWRAGFRQAEAAKQDLQTRGAVEDAAKVIDAIGKLKGAALVTVTGLVLLLGTAWIAASDAGAEAPEDGASSGTSSSPSDPET